MSKNAILIFDIGKTNKKCLVFNEDFEVIDEESTVIAEIADEDGFPCDDIEAIRVWMHEVAREKIDSADYDVTAINFSGYGASFVHLNPEGKPVLPLYNYLKPFTDECEKRFIAQNGNIERISQETASPYLGMLNSGLQLFWLKYFNEEAYQKIDQSLHLPQYLSYTFSQRTQSDFTSIGCHTMLWDFSYHDYHAWVYKENLERKLAPIVSKKKGSKTLLFGKKVTVGHGIHDSSAALLPYLFQYDEPFVLLSTGTWNICLNPFEKEALSKEDLLNDCLMFMGPDGRKVKASRLFLGNEHARQVEMLTGNFGVHPEAYKELLYDEELANELIKDSKRCFSFSFDGNVVEEACWESLGSFKAAYHKLMIELCDYQVRSVQRAIGSSPITKVFIDGGFVDNEIFVQLLRKSLPELEFEPANFPVGSALGAALMVASPAEQEAWKRQRSYTPDLI